MATNDTKAVAEILKANLDDEERRLVEAEQLAAQLRAQVASTRSWLQAHGHMNNDQPPATIPTPKTGEPSGTSTTKDTMVEVLKERGALRMIELTKAVNERGVPVKRGTVDGTVRRYTETFAVQLRNNENWVTLKVK